MVIADRLREFRLQNAEVLLMSPPQPDGLPLLPELSRCAIDLDDETSSRPSIRTLAPNDTRYEQTRKIHPTILEKTSSSCACCASTLLGLASLSSLVCLKRLP